MTSSMNINEILKITRTSRAHLLQQPLHYFSASYASVEYVGICNNLHYYPQMEQFDWSEMTYYNIGASYC